MKNMKKIGWIGAWVMGNAMVQHLIKAGYEVNVYNRTRSKTDNLVVLWAKYLDSVSELSKHSDIIISIIGDPKNVEETYFWQGWVIENAKKWSILVDMTTTKPSLSTRIYESAKQKWLQSLDAPVSGGDTGALQGTLSIMVWGEYEIYEEMLPIFELMGSSVNHIGRAGTWQSTKMANQIAIAWNTIGMTESLLYAEKAGLDLETTIKVLCAWWACSWGYINLAPRILKKDFETYFFIKHFVKDMGIALQECESMNINLPWLELVHQLYISMMNHSQWDLWMQSLIIELKRINNINI